MADGPPHARGIAPGRTALPALLVVVRIAVLALVILGAGRRPVTDVQVLHAERIATSPATPYRNFPVATMPLETATDRTIGSDGATATAVRIAILAFLADLATAAALAWGWGRRPATVYLLLGLPLLSFSIEVSSGFDDCQAGARPKSTPVSRHTATAKQVTRVSKLRSRAEGCQSGSGRKWIKGSLRQNLKKSPTGPLRRTSNNTSLNP